MQGILSFIKFLEYAWPYIVLIVAGIIYIKIYLKKFYEMSAEEQKAEEERLIELAMSKISEIMPSLVATAEENWNYLEKSGIIKRAEVINLIYERYPILKEYSDQETLTKKLDEIIDTTLEKVRTITRKKPKEIEHDIAVEAVNYPESEE